MVRALDTDHLLTFDEYLAFEETSDVRRELVNGHLYAFAGASDRHNLITTNITALLWISARGSNFRVYGSDMKVRVSQHIGYYLDVMVACDPGDNHRPYKRHPCLLIEVLSPSTSLTDRREKLIEYQTIESLQPYIIVYRDEYRVEWYVRNSDDIWVHQTFVDNQDIWFPCVDLTMSVRALYEDVDMSPIVPDQDEPDAR